MRDLTALPRYVLLYSHPRAIPFISRGPLIKIKNRMRFARRLPTLDLNALRKPSIPRMTSFECNLPNDIRMSTSRLRNVYGFTRL